MKQTLVCIDCGKKIPLQKAIPVKWGKGNAFLCPSCYYAGAPALAPRTYNPKRIQVGEYVEGSSLSGGPMFTEGIIIGMFLGRSLNGIPLIKDYRDGKTYQVKSIKRTKLLDSKGKLRMGFLKLNPKKKPRTPTTSAEALIKKEHKEEVAHWTEKLLMQRYVTDREKVLHELVKKAQKDEDLIPVVRTVVSRLKLLPELEQVQRRLARERRNPLYQNFHQANPTLRRIKIRTPKKGEKLVKLGRLIALEYEPEYPSKLRGTVYRHEMGDTGRMVLRNKPVLATGAKGKGLYIIEDKSSPKVTRRGIIG